MICPLQKQSVSVDVVLRFVVQVWRFTQPVNRPPV
jgi:hypothetical protein